MFHHPRGADAPERREDLARPPFVIASLRRLEDDRLAEPGSEGEDRGLRLLQSLDVD